MSLAKNIITENSSRKKIYENLLSQVNKDVLRNNNLVWGMTGSSTQRMRQAYNDAVNYRIWLIDMSHIDPEQYDKNIVRLNTNKSKLINEPLSESDFNFAVVNNQRIERSIQKGIDILKRKGRITEEKIREIIADPLTISYPINKRIIEVFGRQEAGTRFNIEIIEESDLEDWYETFINIPNDVEISPELEREINELNEEIMKSDIIPTSNRIYDGIKKIQSNKRLSQKGFVEEDDYSGATFADLYNRALDIIRDVYGSIKSALTIFISKQEDIEGEEIEQILQDFTTKDCFFVALEKKIKKLSDNCKSNSRKKIYRSALNKTKKLRTVFENGVSANLETIQYIADTVHINIKVHNLLGGYMFDVKRSTGKPIFTLDVVNSRLNHVEPAQNKKNKEVKNKKVLTRIELKDKMDEMINNKEEFITHTFRGSMRAIESINTIFEIERPDYTEVDEFLLDFEKFKIDSDVNPELSHFYSNAFKVCGEIKVKTGDFILPEYDQEKSYSQYKTAPYYQGFPAKIQLFCRVEPDHIIRKGGTYQGMLIKPDHPTHLDIVEFLKTGKTTLDTPEIEYLRDIGFKFIPHVGAWGSTMEFDIPQNLLEKNEYGISGYAMMAGKLGQYIEHHYKTFYCSKLWAKHLKSTTVGRLHEYKSYDEDYVKVSFQTRDCKTFHNLHIASYFTTYARLHLYEQLKYLDQSKIVKINKDGFYTTEENPKLLPTWRTKGEPKKVKETNGKLMDLKHRYINTDNLPLLTESELNELEGTVCLTGCGGSGKSYFACNNPAFIDKLYVADAYRTTEDKKKEYDINTAVVALLTKGKHASKIKHHPSVVIVDEAPKYHGQLVSLMKEFPYSKFILIADINKKGKSYQLEDFNTTKDFPVNLIHSWKNFNNNRRCKDPKLLKILNSLRDAIDNNRRLKQFTKMFQKITTAELVEQYTKEDFVLVSRRSCGKKVMKCENKDCNEKQECKDHKHMKKVRCGEHWCNHDAESNGKQIEYYTDLLKGTGEKYMMTKRSKKYENGTIMFEKPDVGDSLYESRHAFTVHSVQGMTIKDKKIYIDASKFWLNEMFYVAVSRAEYWDQIYIIDDTISKATLMMEEIKQPAKKIIYDDFEPEFDPCIYNNISSSSSDSFDEDVGLFKSEWK